MPIPLSGCQDIVASTPIPVSKDIKATVPFWGPEYEIEIDVKFDTWTGTWGNIFRFYQSLENGDCCEIGQRIPSIWTYAGSSDRLYLCTNIDDNGDRCFSDELGKFEKNKWYNFKFSQIKDEVKSISFGL